MRRKARTLITLLVIATLMLTLGGCNGESNNDVSSGNGNVVTANLQQEVARVNDRIITEEQLWEQMVIASTLAARRTLSLYTEEELEELRENTLEFMISNLVIRDFLENEIGIEGLTGGIAAVGENIAGRLRSNHAVNLLLDNGTIAPESFEEHIAFTTYSNWFFTVVAAETDLSDETVEAYYEANREDFQRTYIAASHIVVISYDEVLEIMARIDAGEDFEELARQFSLDVATRGNGGSIWPEFGRNETFPEFEEAVFDMEVGEIRAPVQTSFGNHIIRLDGRRTEEPAWGVVRTFIEDTFIRRAANEKLRELRENASITIFDEADS